MRVAIVNLGCKVNKVESDTIALSYLNRGAELVDEQQADVVVVNTCTVTGEAEKKTRKAVRHALRVNPQAQVLVTGCAAAIDPDFFTGLDARVAVVGKADLMESHGDDDAPSIRHLQRVGGTFPSRVAVKAQDGCNHACSYCIVHVARGRAWSRPAQEVVGESLVLAKAGAKEIVLSGIDLGSYLDRCGGDRMRLGGLVRGMLAALDEAGCDQTRIRVSSVEPRSLDEGFIRCMAEGDGRVCRHVHLPLQSGSSKVLREMNRPYDADAFRAIVRDLQRAVPGVSITTDVIVGFPGETEEDFEETLALVREVGFTKVHVFRYSPRIGTPAAQRSDQVPPQVKEERAKRLQQLSDELRAAYARRCVGVAQSVVVEDGGWGTTESYFKIVLDGVPTAGSLIEVVPDSIDDDAVLRGRFSA